MAYIGIQGQPCPKCGSIGTVEIGKPTGGPNIEREVYLQCYECKHEESYGRYRLLANSLVKS